MVFWIFKKLKRSKKVRSKITKKRGSALYLKYKKQARLFIEERIKYLNSFYNFEFKRISIRNQKTRWGSCSKTGNLNFNYKLLLIPQHLADYVIVHELCHLGEFNHSKNFWSLVAQTTPNHRELRGVLRKHRV